MRVLGVDPGITATGWGVLDETAAARPRVLACGTIRPPAHGDPGARLAAIWRGLREVIAAWGPRDAAVEQVLVARSARSALVLGQARGVALLAAAEAGLAVHEYLPMHVKQVATGYGHAEKGQVQRMIPRLLDLDAVPGSADAADALAVALCHLARRRLAAVAPPSRRRVSEREAWAALARERCR